MSHVRSANCLLLFYEPFETLRSNRKSILWSDLTGISPCKRRTDRRLRDIPDPFYPIESILTEVKPCR
jgi:hypothetical protein